MNKEDITKEQLKKFLELRDKGLINVADIRKRARMGYEPEELYEVIVLNFSYLVNKFLIPSK